MFYPLCFVQVHVCTEPELIHSALVLFQVENIIDFCNKKRQNHLFILTPNENSHPDLSVCFSVCAGAVSVAFLPD